MLQRGFWKLGLVLALLLAVYASPVQADEKKDQDTKAMGNAAIVNDTAISRDEFDREVDQLKQRYTMQGEELDPAKLDEMKKEILENLIDRELLYQASMKSGIKIETKVVDDELAGIKKRFPDEKAFNDALGQMGFSEQTIKDQITKGMMVKEFVETKLTNKTAVGDKDVQEFYNAHPEMFKEAEQVKASHILIKTEEGADAAQKDAAHKKIEGIQKQIKEGKVFADLAKEHSDCPSKSNGGDLGYFKRGDMVKPFEDTAFGLKPDTVSDIVETRFGYHLILVTDKKPESTIPFDSVKDKISKYLENESLQKGVEDYLQQLKKDATIQRFI